MLRASLCALACALLCASRPAAPVAAKPAQAEPAEWTVAVAAKARSAVVAVTVKQRLSGGRTKDLTGAGFVADGRGLIVTCAHVVAGCPRARVRLHDGAEVQGRVLVADAALDLAVLRVEAGRTLPSLRLGDSARLRPGESVLAVGHPGGYEYTLTAGIVSGTGREIDTPLEVGKLRGMVQHSAAIAPGNSGGPLLDRRGEVVGVNAAYHQEASGVAWACGAEGVRKILWRILPGE